MIIKHLMVDRIIKPLTTDGKLTIPKEIRDEYHLKDYVEIEKVKNGILIKAH